MLVEAKEQIEKDMQKENAEEKEKEEEDDNNDGDLVGGEGEKSRKESQPLIVRDAIVEVIVKMFFSFYFSFAAQVQTEKEWEKLIHTEGLVIVDIYCAWCSSAITIILFIVHGAL